MCFKQIQMSCLCDDVDRFVLRVEQCYAVAWSKTRSEAWSDTGDDDEYNKKLYIHLSMNLKDASLNPMKARLIRLRLEQLERFSQEPDQDRS
jgi:hypothetical protein